MANNTPNQHRPRWTNSELSSLTTWYNEGVPLQEIARRLGRSHASVSGALNNRRGILNLQNPLRRTTVRRTTTKTIHPVIEERKNARKVIHHDVQKNNLLTIMTSIIQIGDVYQARIWIARNELTHFRGITMAEFNSTDACHRWFKQEVENYRFD